MSCPVGTPRGFLRLDTTIPVNTWKNQTTNAFYMNFAPRGVPLQYITNTQIGEDTQNTLLYENITYTINSVQLCPESIYIYNNSKSTLVFTFKPNSSANIYAIIIIVPITNGSNNAASAYLTDINKSPEQGIYGSMETVIKDQPVVSYPSCVFEKNVKHTVMIYNLLNGIVITNTLPSAPYVLDSLEFGIDKTHTINDTYIPNMVTYYSEGIRSSNNKYATNKNLPVDKYQCQPFDQTKNLQINPGGVDRVSLKSIIKQNDVANEIGLGISFNDLLSVWVTLFSIIGAIVLIGMVLAYPLLFPEQARPNRSAAPPVNPPT